MSTAHCLVVPPRLAPVEQRRREQRRGGRDARGDPRRLDVAHRQALEPEEGQDEHGEQGAADELALEVEHDRGHHVERDEQQQGQRPEAGPPARARPEGQHGRAHRQHRPADPQREHRRLVDAAVGHVDARKRLHPAPDPAEEGAPALGPQLLVGDPAREQRERHGGDRDERGGERPQHSGKPRGAEQREDHAGGDRHREPGTARLGGIEHPHPVQPAEHGEAHQHQPPDRGERQRGPTGALAHLRRGGGQGAHAAPPTAARTASTGRLTRRPLRRPARHRPGGSRGASHGGPHGIHRAAHAAPPTAAITAALPVRPATNP